MDVVLKEEVKVRKVGILEGNNDLQVALDAGDFAAILTNYERVEDSVTVVLPLLIGEGPSARLIRLEVAISQRILMAQRETPMNLDPDGGVRADKNRYCAGYMFRNQVFIVSDELATSTYNQEAALLIRRYVYGGGHETQEAKAGGRGYRTDLIWHRRL